MESGRSPSESDYASLFSGGGGTIRAGRRPKFTGSPPPLAGRAPGGVLPGTSLAPEDSSRLDQEHHAPCHAALPAAVCGLAHGQGPLGVLFHAKSSDGSI